MKGNGWRWLTVGLGLVFMVLAAQLGTAAMAPHPQAVTALLPPG